MTQNYIKAVSNHTHKGERSQQKWGEDKGSANHGQEVQDTSQPAYLTPSHARSDQYECSPHEHPDAQTEGNQALFDISIKRSKPIVDIALENGSHAGEISGVVDEYLFRPTIPAASTIERGSNGSKGLTDFSCISDVSLRDYHVVDGTWIREDVCAFCFEGIESASDQCDARCSRFCARTCNGSTQVASAVGDDDGFAFEPQFGPSWVN